jgi:hypothetical protein
VLHTCVKSGIRLEHKNWEKTEQQKYFQVQFCLTSY